MTSFHNKNHPNLYFFYIFKTNVIDIKHSDQSFDH